MSVCHSWWITSLEYHMSCFHQSRRKCAKRALREVGRHFLKGSFYNTYQTSLRLRPQRKFLRLRYNFFAISKPPFQAEEETDLPSTTITIVAPLKAHTHTMIFLHGREDYGQDLAKSFFDSKSSHGSSMADIFPTTRFVFPTSKIRYSARHDFEFSNSSFAEMFKSEEFISQWFDTWDIKNPEERQELTVPGLTESVLEVLEVVKEEAKLVTL